MNQSAKTPSRIHELIALLEDHVGLHGQLAATMEVALEMVRRADTAGMSSVALQQQGLVQRIRHREGLRRQIMDRIGVELGKGPRLGRTMTVSRIAGEVGNPLGERLIDCGRRLKTEVDRIAQLNRVHERVSSRMHAHTSLILAAVRPQKAASADYSGDGRTVDRVNMGLFEAVG